MFNLDSQSEPEYFTLQHRDSVITGEVRDEYSNEPKVGKIHCSYTQPSYQVDPKELGNFEARKMPPRPPRLCDIRPNVTRDYFKHIKFLGKGAHSMINLVRCSINFKLYALKECSKTEVARFHKVQNLMREKDIMDSLNHPNIVRLENTFQDDNSCYFCLEYHPLGDLASLIRGKKKLSVELTRFYTMELINALESLRDLNVVHRDIKPENILIDENFHCKLSDFGSAKVIDPVKVKRDLEEIDFNAEESFSNDMSFTPEFDRESLTPELPKHMLAKQGTFVGTPLYVSPEMLAHSIS